MHPLPTARELKALAAGLERELDAAAVPRLLTFLELVARWNARLDLTAARTASALAEIMLADALVLADRALVPEGARLLDVGTGAGAPALPLLVLRPDLTATCVEPRRKRVAFLRTAIGTLGLAGAQVVEGRLERGDPPPAGGPFDVALSRATFEPATWLELAAPLAARVLVLTAREPPPAAPSGLAETAQRAYRLPFSGAPRHVGVYAKV